MDAESVALDDPLARDLRDIAYAAGAVILEIYAKDFQVDAKADASPVTEADRLAEALILERLAPVLPDVPIVAEESVAAGRIPDISGDRFWLVDPLDGTREFISRNGEFTVNIALIRDGSPVAGVVHAPAKNRLYLAAEDGRAWREIDGGRPEPIACRPCPSEGAVAMVSRSHRSPETETWLKEHRIADMRDAGSSLKFCTLAEGAADLYPRLGRTMEWDIAAGHAVLKAAGGSVTRLDGGAFTYGKPGFENPHFVARGRA